MNVRDAIQNATKRLQPRRITCAVDRDLGRLEADILLAFVLKKDRVWLLAHASDELRATSYERFNRLLLRREKHTPIAYITGEKEFYGMPFHVNRRVLIPRPETELLAELATTPSDTQGGGQVVVWDVGTGSGAVAIAIAKHLPRARVLATDISSDVLALARQNARLNHVKNITFLRANLLDTNVRDWLKRRGTARRAPTQHVTIVANLPYLPLSDKKRIAPDVVNYEPSTALFAGKTGLEIIEKFLRQLAAFDVHFTAAYLEFDPPQTKRLVKFTKKLFAHATIRVHRDLAGKERVLEIRITQL